MALSVSFHGQAQLRQRLEKLVRQYPQAAAAALYQEGLRVWRESVKRAPVQFGVLRTSAYVAPPQKVGGDVVVEVGFGTVYAARQHEETTWQHPRGGEAKYLQNALNQLRGGMLRRMATQIKANVARGVTAAVVAAPIKPRVAGRMRRASRAGSRRRRRRR